jgi:hypothetical protein
MCHGWGNPQGLFRLAIGLPTDRLRPMLQILKWHKDMSESASILVQLHAEFLTMEIRKRQK